MTTNRSSNLCSRVIYRKDLDENLSSATALRVVITESSHYIARSLAYRILSEAAFGPDREIILSLYDTEASERFLETIGIEVTASAPNLLRSIAYSQEPSVAFKDADVVISIGKARDYNFSKSDVKHDPFFRDAVIATKNDATAIETYARKDAKVITLGNTAARIIAEFAPSIPKENITAVSLVLRNFANFSIAKRTGRVASEVRNLIVWGSNSKYALPHCEYARFSDGKSVVEEIRDDEWCKKTLPGQLMDEVFRQNRYRTSEAVALAEHCRCLFQGTPANEWTCMIVHSDGSYGVEAGTFFSMPVYCADGGKWEIVEGLKLDDYCKGVIKDILVSIDEKVVAALKICNSAGTSSAARKSSQRKSIIKIKLNDDDEDVGNECI